MPSSPLRPCAEPNCPVLVVRGRCPQHTKQVNQRRWLTAHKGYTASPGSPWQAFRRRFVALLLEAGMAPVCGASLPGGAQTARYSQCLKDGLKNGEDLHLDHEPPLTEAEHDAADRGDRRAFDDPLRVGWLCERCHNAKSQRERGQRGEYRTVA